MDFLKKHWSNILFGILIVLLIVPQTRMPIKVFIHRLIATAPSEEKSRTEVQATDWILEDMKGERIRFSQLSGKPVLINFWATWCPPCVAEMPSLDALHTDYKDKMHFLFVSNEDPRTIQDFLDRAGWDLPAYRMLSAPPPEFESRSIPATFVLDPQGAIAVKKIGSANWNAASVRSLIDKMTQ